MYEDPEESFAVAVHGRADALVVTLRRSQWRLVDEELRARRLIFAIKLLREMTPIDLHRCQDLITQRLAKLSRTAPGGDLMPPSPGWQSGSGIS